MRRFGEPVIHGQRYVRRLGVYGVLMRGGRILLTHQSDPNPEFQLPGGGVDPGESSIQALNREVMEETGWVIHRHRRLGAFKRFTYMPEYDLWAEKLCLIYAAQAVRQKSLPLERGHTAVWADPETAVEMLENDGDRHFLIGYLNRL